MSERSTSRRDPAGSRPIRAVGMPRRGGFVRRVIREDRGAATAEYAITIMAAVGFAGLLVVIMKSGEVQQILTELVRNALSVGG